MDWSTPMRRSMARLLVLLPLLLALAGCWFTVRFTDDAALRLEPRFAGRWQTPDGELQIAAGPGCGYLQVIADDDSLRLCSLGSAGDYTLVALYELDDEAVAGADREYTLGVARWYHADRMGLAMADAVQVLDGLQIRYQRESRDPDCAGKPVAEQQEWKCSRALLDPAAVPARLDTQVLARLYADACCENGSNKDETVLRRVPARPRRAMED